MNTAEPAAVLDTVVSFDGTERCVTSLETPDRYRDLVAVFERPGSVAFRGAGLSYCLAGAAPGGRTVSMAHFDRVLGVDREQRTVTVEAGVTVGDLCRVAMRHGLWFPVLPGHPSITVGGCVGFNIHGKTQHGLGHFSDHVESLTLLHPERGELRCSASQEPDLFSLTLGGMGLTGLVLDVTLRLVTLPGTSVGRRLQPVANLVDAVEQMSAAAESGSDALYSWNDLNRRGASFGRGVVFADEFRAGEQEDHRTFPPLAAGARRWPPRAAWVAPVVRVANVAYPLQSRLSARRHYPVLEAAFPLARLGLYFRAFGRRGLRETQLVVPQEAWPSFAADLEGALDRARVPVTLGSLKLFSGRPHHLWFRGDGVCLALDVPASARADDLFDRLDRIAVGHGAVANLAKDSRLPIGVVKEMYPGYSDFAEAVSLGDPTRRIDSPLRQRLGL